MEVNETRHEQEIIYYITYILQSPQHERDIDSKMPGICTGTEVTNAYRITFTQQAGKKGQHVYE